MLEGPEGDILFDYGRRALFHLSADHRVLRCAPAGGTGCAWQRVLLDTILWTVSLLRGFELLHASAVETPAGIVAFVAVSGGGKTSLAAECLRRGAALFCDDILALDDPDGQVVGHPGPPLMNLPLPLTVESLRQAEVIDYFGDEKWVKLVVPPPRAQSRGCVEACAPGSGKSASMSRPNALSRQLDLAGPIDPASAGGRIRSLLRIAWRGRFC